MLNADRRFQTSCPSFEVVEDNEVRLTIAHHNRYNLAFIWYLFEISRRIAVDEDHPTDEDFLEHVDLQKTFLEELQILIRERKKYEADILVRDE